MSLKKNSIILLIVVALSACDNRNNITIEGSYPAGKGQYLELEMLNIAQTQFIDSVKVGKKGQFRFRFDLDAPELVLVKNQRNQVINLLAYPEDEITLEIPDTSFRKGYKVSGSSESEQIRELVKNVENTRAGLDSIARLLDRLDEQESPEASALVGAYNDLLLQQKKSHIRFIVQNLSSLSSVYALYQRIAPDVYIFNELRDLQYFKIVADSVGARYPGSSLAMSLTQDVRSRFEDYQTMITLNELSKTNQVESGLIDLVIEDEEGTEQSLKALEGKVVLLNFWASWNTESRETSRRYIPVYEKYRSRGFEVYAVALDNDRSQWRSTIYYEQFPWINVSELTYPSSYAANIYNVTALPTNYLIDREGNIVAKNIPADKLSTWLDNLL